MKKLFSIIIILVISIIFYNFSEINYKKQKEIQENIIVKPNFLPKSEYAKITAFWFSNLKADFYRLSLIQYIGSNILKSEYKEYLYNMTNIINSLNPYYEDPYVLSELLLTNYNIRYEKLSEKERSKYINQAIEIWQKAIKNFCEADKIALIEKENNLEKLFWEEKYKNPCKKYSAIYNLAYIYFYYKKNPEKATKYYKIASVIDWSPSWIKNMIAVMQSKAWNREKSYFMFLNMAKITEKNDDFCKNTANSLEKIWKNLFFSNLKINSKLIKDLEKLRIENLPFDEKDWMENTNCKTYLNKAIRELNSYYLDEANKKYFAEKGKNSKNPEELLKNWFIDYIPKDFQKYSDYGIIYYFNEETGSYDTKMEASL